MGNAFLKSGNETRENDRRTGACHPKGIGIQKCGTKPKAAQHGVGRSGVTTAGNGGNQIRRTRIRFVSPPGAGSMWEVKAQVPFQVIPC